ncbi:MAG: Clp protease ClpP, partial [Planctomycetes bacterium SCN 63-9]
PAVILICGMVGCQHPIKVLGQFQGAGSVNAQADIRGEVAIKLPSSPDPGPMVASIVQHSERANPAPRVALIDVDGLLLNQNLEGMMGTGENPVSSFREKLSAVAQDPSVAAVVLRINSPGGAVTASDIMADELDRFRASSRKPVIACLMDVATGGGYYLALGADRIIAHPTALTGGVGVIFNHYNLQDAMAQLNIMPAPIKAGEHIDMGSITIPLDEQKREMLQEMANSLRERFAERVVRRRPALTTADQKAYVDGRILAAPKALALHLIDRTGYIHDAIQEAEQLAGLNDAEVVIYHRAGSPARTLYTIAPTPPRLSDAIPFSYPGLDRGKLPAFLYLWQPDPTVPKNAVH